MSKIVKEVIHANGMKLEFIQKIFKMNIFQLRTLRDIKVMIQLQ